MRAETATNGETDALRPSERNVRPGRYKTLDGMRGLAALAVVCYHIGLAVDGSPLKIAHGYLAVDLFFALSGFVLSRVYEPRFAKGLSFGSFMTSRIKRLYPTYLIGCLIGAAVVIFSLDNSARLGIAAIAPNLLILPSIGSVARNFPGYTFPLNIPFWSLFLELWVANVALGLLGRRLNATTSLLICLLSGASLLWFVHIHRTMDFGATFDGFAGSLPRVLFSFFAGVLVNRWAAKLPLPAVPSWLILAILGATFCAPAGGRAGAIYDLCCVFFVYPALIALGARAVEKRPQLGAFLGDVSYMIYAIHSPLVLAFAAHFPARSLVGSAVSIVGLLVALIALAAGLERWVDRPIRATLFAKP